MIKVLVLSCVLVSCLADPFGLPSWLRQAGQRHRHPRGCADRAEGWRACARLDAAETLAPHSSDCSLFFYCRAEGVRPTCRRCPAGLYFNPALQVCDWPTNVDCRPRLPHPRPPRGNGTTPEPTTPDLDASSTTPEEFNTNTPETTPDLDAPSTTPEEFNTNTPETTPDLDASSTTPEEFNTNTPETTPDLDAPSTTPEEFNTNTPETTPDEDAPSTTPEEFNTNTPETTPDLDAPSTTPEEFNTNTPETTPDLDAPSTTPEEFNTNTSEAPQTSSGAPSSEHSTLTTSETTSTELTPTYSWLDYWGWGRK